MSTLILARAADGSPRGRCDSKCYNAKGPKCTCICGGVNHGAGKNNAIDNTRSHKEFLMDAQEAGEFIINPGQYQLFTGGKS
ncbi:hypothetical protein ES702_02947 [subsurface metagenome]